jgi:hypothetical protein
MGVFLWLWSGTKWVKGLCSAAGALRVVRAGLPITVTRADSTGAITATATALFWMHLNPSAGNSVLELTDDLDGESAVFWDDFHTERNAEMHTFDPPLPFANGIYVKTLTNFTSIHFGYE